NIWAGSGPTFVKIPVGFGFLISYSMVIIIPYYMLIFNKFLYFYVSIEHQFHPKSARLALGFGCYSSHHYCTVRCDLHEGGASKGGATVMRMLAEREHRPRIK